MSVEHLEVLVEEPSMEAALRRLLPRMLGPMSFNIHPYEGKSNLLRKLSNRLKGYSLWLPDSWRVLVLVDRDDEDCAQLKRLLEQAAQEANLATRSAPTGGRYTVVNRLAIEELEAWYFGDWEAVKKAYPRVSATVPSQAKYRRPDHIRGGTWEAFERVLKRAQHFKTGLRKIEAARAIAEHMDPSRNRSPSFQALRDSLAAMMPS